MYGKLFASLYQGTLRGRSDEILVFTNLVAHADSRGFVDKHWLAIAQETGLSIEQVKAAIEVLEAPDPDSRSPEENGRRLVRMDEHRAWGWRIVNHAKYRAIRSEEDRREQNRLAQERFRDKSNKSKPRKPRSAKAEAEAEALKPSRASRSELSADFAAFWESYPRKKSKANAEKAWLKIKPDEQLTERILHAVEQAKTSADWQREAGRFIPHPASWLNAKGWEDEHGRVRVIPAGGSEVVV